MMERARTEISSDLLRRAREMAEARGSDERELLEELIEESLRMRRFPGIAFRDGPAGRRARVLGTALDVWEVIEACQQMGEERLISESHLSERQIDLARAYYESYPEEIESFISENRLSEEELHGLSPAVIPPSPSARQDPPGCGSS
jgi:hypothetical protein